MNKFKEKFFMIIAEHKLNLIRQIDELPEQSLIELEKIIMQLKANHSIQPVKKNSLKIGSLLMWCKEDNENDYISFMKKKKLTNLILLKFPNKIVCHILSLMISLQGRIFAMFREKQ